MIKGINFGAIARISRRVMEWLFQLQWSNWDQLKSFLETSVSRAKLEAGCVCMGGKWILWKLNGWTRRQPGTGQGCRLRLFLLLSRRSPV